MIPLSDGDMIEECLNNMELLTNWEQDFVESVSEALLEYPSLTDAQADKLEQIYKHVKKYKR